MTLERDGAKQDDHWRCCNVLQQHTNIKARDCVSGCTCGSTAIAF